MIHPYSHIRRAPPSLARPDPLIDGERTLTFAELDERASTLAQASMRVASNQGIAPPSSSTIAFEYVVTVIAVARAGGALTPMLGAPPRAGLHRHRFRSAICAGVHTARSRTRPKDRSQPQHSPSANF